MKKSKILGELAEQMFCVEVIRRGGVPCKPIGDSCKYDWVVIAGRKITRVQVKSSWITVMGDRGYRHPNRCRIMSSGGSRKKMIYKASEFDVLAIWLNPFKSWVIKPISFIKGRVSLSVLKTQLSNSGWDLLGLA
jgi:hypothetical protein